MPRLKPAFLLIAVFFFTGTSIRLADLSLPRRMSADEQIYTGQALNMVNLGPLRGNRATSQKYLLNPEKLAMYPPPTRIAYVLPVAFTMWITGNRTEQAGAWVSCAASILSLAVAVLLGLECFGDWPTVIGLALLSVFPPDLLVANRCWADSLAGLICLTIAYLTLKIWSGIRVNPIEYVLLVAAGSLSLLVKETCILVYAPCLLAALWKAWKDSRRNGFLLLSSSVIGGMLDVSLWSALTGQVGTFIRVVQANQQSTLVSSYALRWQTGPPYLLLHACWVLSPFAVGLLIVGATVLCFPGRGRYVGHTTELRLLAVGSTAFFLLFALVPHWMNVRYLSPIFVPVCLLAGLGAFAVATSIGRLVRPRARIVLACAGMAALALSMGSERRRFERYEGAGINDAPALMVLAFDRSLQARNHE